MEQIALTNQVNDVMVYFLRALCIRLSLIGLQSITKGDGHKMNNKHYPSNPCHPDDQSPFCSCPERDYLIKEEEEALAKLWEIKQEANAVKAEIRGLQGSIELDLLEKAENVAVSAEGGAESKHGGLVTALRQREERLKELKALWNEWDRKRKRANREKLIRLGHISPFDPEEF